MTTIAEKPEEFLFSVLHEIASAACQGAAYEKWSDRFAREEVGEVWHNLTVPLRRARTEHVSIEQLRAMDDETLLRLGVHRWDGSLWVLPLWCIHYIDPAAILRCINGADVPLSDADLDVRGGCIAYGFVK